MPTAPNTKRSRISNKLNGRTGKTVLHTASDTKLVLYNDSFIQLAQNDNISSSNTFSRIEKTLQPETYYLTIVNQDLNNIAVNCYLILERFDTGEDTSVVGNGELCGNYTTYADSMYDFYKISDANIK